MGNGFRRTFPGTCKVPIWAPTVAHMDTTSQPPPIIRAIEAQMAATDTTILQLSKDADIPRSTLQRRLRTGRGLQLEEINRIAAALGTTASQIITQAEAA